MKRHGARGGDVNAAVAMADAQHLQMLPTVEGLSHVGAVDRGAELDIDLGQYLAGLGAAAQHRLGEFGHGRMDSGDGEPTAGDLCGGDDAVRAGLPQLRHGAGLVRAPRFSSWGS